MPEHGIGRESVCSGTAPVLQGERAGSLRALDEAQPERRCISGGPWIYSAKELGARF